MNIDEHFYSDITVGIKAFSRVKSLERTLEHLLPFKWHEVVVADDGPEDQERFDVYNKYQDRLPLRILRLPFDTGLAAGRNAIVDSCKTDYILILDDDQGVRQDIWKLKEIIKSDPKIGGVSCVWDEYGKRKCNACNLHFVGNVVVKDVGGKLQRHGVKGNEFLYFDFIPNSTLYRVECLRELKWDPFYKICKEHIDFYLAHKKLNKWRFCLAENVLIDHFPEKGNKEYSSFRHSDERRSRSAEYLKKKFNIRHVLKARKYQGKGDKWLTILLNMGFGLRLSLKFVKLKNRLIR